MKFKYVILLIVLASLGAIVTGFIIKADNLILANKCIGAGTVGIFFLAMPMFLYKKSKGKKMKDYMLTKENIEKMQKKERQNTGNQ